MASSFANFLRSAFFLLGSYFGMYPKESGLAVREGPPPLIPREVLYGNPNRTIVKMSPDGEYIAFMAPYEKTLNIWIQRISRESNSSNEKPRLVTYEKERGILGYSWTYLKGIIIYSQDSDGDENVLLYKLNITEPKAEVLIGEKGVKATIVSSSFKYPDTLFVGLNNRNPRFHDIYRVNIPLGTRQLLMINNGFKGFIFDNDMNLRLGSTETPTGGTDLVEPVKDDLGVIRDWKLYRSIPFDEDYGTGIMGFTEDNQQVYWQETFGRDLAALILKNFSAPSSKGLLLYEPKKSDVEGFIFHPKTNLPLALYEHYMKPELKILNQTIAEDFKILEALNTERVPFLSDSSFDFGTWLVRIAADNAPSEYFVYHRHTKTLNFLFKSRDDFVNYKLSKLHPREVQTRDGLTQVCYLGLPVESDPLEVGSPLSPVPMILRVHGGPWSRDRWTFDSDYQFWTNRGYGILSCNYRGSTGFGKKFFQASFGEWAGKMQTDLIDAVHWAVKRKIADPTRVAIMGGSYGGYATLVGLSFTPEMFACGIDIVGPSNLVSLISSIPPYWEPLYNSFVKRLGGDPRTPQGLRYLNQRSPLYFAHTINKPLLIAQGANDPRVKQRESDQIVAKLKENSIPVSYLVFPDEGHGFVRPQNRLLFQAVSEFFFRDCLGGRVQPLEDEFQRSNVTFVEKGLLNFRSERFLN